MHTRAPSMLLVDDNEDLLKELADGLGHCLGDEAEIRTWRPQGKESLLDKLAHLVDDDTVIVITDFDLTSGGVTGLFGASIVTWCQTRALPAGNFSRGHALQVTTEPDLFELRIPTEPADAVKFSAEVFRGFRDLRSALEGEDGALADLRSPAVVLASLVKKPHLETSFSQYFSGAGDGSGALLDTLRRAGTNPPGDPVKRRVLAYLIGHVLINAVLRYPGPVLSHDELCAYVAAGPTETFDGLFNSATYSGPFARARGQMYWRDDVDRTLDALAAGAGDVQGATAAELSRTLIERRLGRSVKRHSCSRCNGQNGGFWCPFTIRAVCERADCSVAATSWVPAGADLARVERVFYDEWAPILGL